MTDLGIPGELGADVITTTIGRFELPLSLTQAAAELGVEPARLHRPVTADCPRR